MVIELWPIDQVPKYGHDVVFLGDDVAQNLTSTAIRPEPRTTRLSNISQHVLSVQAVPSLKNNIQLPTKMTTKSEHEVSPVRTGSPVSSGSISTMENTPSLSRADTELSRIATPDDTQLNRPSLEVSKSDSVLVTGGSKDTKSIVSGTDSDLAYDVRPTSHAGPIRRRNMSETAKIPLPSLNHPIKRQSLSLVAARASMQIPPASASDKSSRTSVASKPVISVQIPASPYSGPVSRRDPSTQLKTRYPPRQTPTESSANNLTIATSTNHEAREHPRSPASSSYSRYSRLPDDYLDHIESPVHSRSATEALYPVMNPWDAPNLMETSFLDLDSSPMDEMPETFSNSTGPASPTIASEPEARASVAACGPRDREAATEPSRKTGVVGGPSSEDAELDTNSNQSSSQQDAELPTLIQARQQLEEKLQTMIDGTQDQSFHSRSSSDSSTVRSTRSISSRASSPESPLTEYDSEPMPPTPRMKALKKNASTSSHGSKQIIVPADELIEEDQEANVEDNPEDENTQIEASAATSIIYLILSNLPDLSSLFAAARISKGFYTVFKTHEFALIQSTVKKMSPAVAQLCGLCFAEGHILASDNTSTHVSTDPAVTYLRGYDHVMYTVVSLKNTIAERCQGLLNRKTIARMLCEANDERAMCVDSAFVRIWTFCRIFGRRRSRIGDIAAQKEWLSALSRRELEDIVEAWKSLYALLVSLDIGPPDVEHAGAGLLKGSQNPKQIMREWLHHLLTLGPQVVLDLALTQPNTSIAMMEKARSKAWTKWNPPSGDQTLTTFLSEAVTRVHVEKVLAETRNMSIAVPQRAAGHSVHVTDLERPVPRHRHRPRANSQHADSQSRRDVFSACPEVPPITIRSRATTKKVQSVAEMRPQRSYTDRTPLPGATPRPLPPNFSRKQLVRASTSYAAPCPSSPLLSEGEAHYALAYSKKSPLSPPATPTRRGRSKQRHCRDSTVSEKDWISGQPPGSGR